MFNILTLIIKLRGKHFSPLTSLRIIKYLPFKHFGMCYYFFQLSGKYPNQYSELDWEKWDKFSGDHFYPVPGGVYEEYELWKKSTLYGKNRYELLDWCINQIKASKHSS